jgi:formylglycine-generating enzyme required for sulfatase activity
MYYVSWYDAKAFCDTLSSRTGKTYRLATEEEWEYAARGGKWSRGYWYSGSNNIDSAAWYNLNSGTNGGSSEIKAHIVGTTKSQGNELGIYDMSGNVEEWSASYRRDTYDGLEATSFRMIRGGSWEDGAMSCLVGSRTYDAPSNRSPYVGFRVV